MARIKPKIRSLAVSQLGVDREVQRYEDPAKTARIKRDFNESALGIITISQRDDGTYHIADGQHRVSAARDKMGDDYQVDCKIFVGLSREEEALLFRILNDTNRPRPFDIFRVRVIEQDPVAVEILKIIEAYGWRLSTSNETGAFAAVVSAEHIYKRDHEALDLAISIITGAWGKTPKASDGRILKALGQVLLRYGDAIDADELVEKLAATPGPEDLLVRAMGLVQIRRGSIINALAEILVDDIYNKRKRNPLPGWRSRR